MHSIEIIGWQDIMIKYFGSKWLKKYYNIEEIGKIASALALEINKDNYKKNKEGKSCQ